MLYCILEALMPTLWFRHEMGPRNIWLIMAGRNYFLKETCQPTSCFSVGRVRFVQHIKKNSIKIVYENDK